jgi:hypothetical protein
VLSLSRPQSRMVEISAGDPGAITVLIQLQAVPELMEYLHEHGPSGSGLWMLYKDDCGEDIAALAATLSARASEFQT